MATSTDVLAAAQDEISSELTDLFCTYNPIMEELFTRPTRQAKGPSQTFVVNTGGPGSLGHIDTGFETSNQPRLLNASRGSATPARFRYTYEVPRKEMAEIRDANGVRDLIEKYPIAAMDDIRQAFAAQFLRGASSSGVAAAEFLAFDALATLNGQQTYEPETGLTENGIMLFAAPAAQTETIFGLASQGAPGVTGWYNQFINLGNSTQLYTGLRAMQSRAAQLGKSMNKPDMGFADELTFQNLMTQLTKHVQIPMVKGDIVDKRILERGGLIFHQGLVIYQDVAMDLSDATSWGVSASEKGVLYMLCSKDWEIVNYAPKGAGSGWFEFNALGQVPRSDFLEYEIILHACIYTKNRRNQGVLVGGAEGAIQL
jgi:hypothetical protein